MSNQDPPKFEFQGGFSVGGVNAGENADSITNGVEDISLQVTAPAATNDVENEDGNVALSGKELIILNRVSAIRKMHNVTEEIDGRYKAERLALEKKYLAEKQVILDARNKIITGDVDPEMINLPDSISKPIDGGDQPEKGIPGFWLTCLLNHPSMGDLITEEDLPALEAITDIKCEYSEDFKEFTLTFCFKPNEYFSNLGLVKRYVVSPDLLDDRAPALSECTGTEINWKPGKNLTVTEVTKKQKAKSGKNKGQVRTVVTQKPKHSFFHYFGDPMTEEEAEEEEENGNEEEEPIKLTMEEDYDIGHAIRTSIIPQAILWYTGEATGDEDDDDEDYEDEDDEDDEEDDDDDDDEENDDDDEANEPVKPKKSQQGKKKVSGGGLSFTPQGGFAAPPPPGSGEGAGAGGEQPECKQN